MWKYHRSSVWITSRCWSILFLLKHSYFYIVLHVINIYRYFFFLNTNKSYIWFDDSIFQVQESCFHYVFFFSYKIHITFFKVQLYSLSGKIFKNFYYTRPLSFPKIFTQMNILKWIYIGKSYYRFAQFS